MCNLYLKPIKNSSLQQDNAATYTKVWMKFPGSELIEEDPHDGLKFDCNLSHFNIA